jgi:hypothetical protein
MTTGSSPKDVEPNKYRTLRNAGFTDSDRSPSVAKASRTSPALMEKLLASAEAMASIPGPVRRQAERELQARKRHLLGAACSSPWFSDCWASGAPFPPRADTTPMRPCRCWRCRLVKRVWPAIYTALSRSTSSTHEACAEPEEFTDKTEGEPGSILSYECYLESLSDWEAAQVPSSPSGIALRAIREGRVKLRRQRTRLGRRSSLAQG